MIFFYRKATTSRQ